MKFDPSQEHAVIYGSDNMRYLQKDMYFNAAGDPVKPIVNKKGVELHEESLRDEVSGAALFLRAMLTEPRAKSVVYAEAERNNQVWEDVTQAKKDLKVHVFHVNKTEMWKLVTE